MQIHISECCPESFDTNFVEDTLHKAADTLSQTNLTNDGRGAIYLRRDCTPNVIVRRYRRGGLIGRIVHDRYFKIPMLSRQQSTRMERELALLEHIHALELPAPHPLAIAIDRRAFSYTGYLLTEYIPNTSTLSSKLNAHTLTQATWESIGRTIKRFHNAQIFHSDLNATNILLDDALNPYLIDFDKCCVKTGESWKDKNLQRLLRSLDKMKRLNPEFKFTQSHWQWLLNAYQN